MGMAIFFSAVIVISMLLVCVITLYGVRKKMITLIFGTVLIVCAVAVGIWTIEMIFKKVPVMVVSTN